MPENLIRIYSDDECNRMIQAAKDLQIGGPLRWDLMVLTAFCTGMRRGEILNTTWQDIDFDLNRVIVKPKKDTEHTWEWHIKDVEIRKLPLPEEIVQLLAKHQSEQPSGYPYVFVPSVRYDRIQTVRRQGNWSVSKGRCPLNNFTRQFKSIMQRAGIDSGEFHDLRCTCITNWFANGLNELEVMKMAGHSSFETTRKFYLAIKGDLLEKTRVATERSLQGISIAKPLQR